MSPSLVSHAFKIFRAEIKARQSEAAESSSTAIIKRGKHDQAPLNEIAHMLTDRFGPPAMHYSAGEFEIIIRKKDRT
jgi:hypothetical protein